MRRFSRFGRAEDGATLVFVAISMPLIMLLLALVIDLDIGRLTKNRLQIAADSAALAGASMLPDAADTRSEAVQYALANYPVALSGSPVLVGSDVTIGHWNGVTFNAGASPSNAVFVTTRRDDTASNPVLTLFASFAGVDEFNISASSIAVAQDMQLACTGGGILTEDDMSTWPYLYSSTLGSNFCLYADDELQIGWNNTIEEDAVVVLPNLSDFSESTGNSWFDRDAQLKEETWSLPFVGLLSDILNAIENNTIPGFTPTEVVRIGSGPTLTLTPEAGKLYIVDRRVLIPDGINVSNTAILATNRIDIGANVTIEGSIIASRNEVETADDVTIGASSPCAATSFDTYLFAATDVEIGRQATIRGVQVVAADEFRLEDNSTALGLYVEVGGDVNLENNLDLQTCPSTVFASDFGNIPDRELDPTDFALVQ